jgi:single-strand DNA-binding protein
LFGHGFGAFHAPGGSSLFCFCGFQKNLFAKNAQNISPDPPQMQSFGTREHGPLALFVTRSSSGNSTNGDTIMYQNNVTLIGFLGNDAEVRTATNDRSFTTFQVATKSSYKDKQSGEYVSHTEWHRCVVFGGLSKFAGTLAKGAHVQVVGELRSREYVPKQAADSKSKKAEAKQHVWEIRVNSILKLDRAEKAAPEDVSDAAEPETEDIPF